MTSSTETYCTRKAAGTTQHSFRALCRPRARTGRLVESFPPRLPEGVARPRFRAAAPLPRFSMRSRREAGFPVSSSRHFTGRTDESPRGGNIYVAQCVSIGFEVVWLSAAERRHLDGFAFRNVAAPRLQRWGSGSQRLRTGLRRFRRSAAEGRHRRLPTAATPAPPAPSPPHPSTAASSSPVAKSAARCRG